MQRLNGVAAVAAWGALAVGGVAVAQDDWQWIPIADSEADFSGVQGQGGWHYLFAASELDPGSPMGIFDPDCHPLNSSAILTSPPWTPHCGSFCAISSLITCTSAASSCSSSGSGLQIPVRRFTPAAAGRFRIRLFVIDDEGLGAAGDEDGVRVTATVGSALMWQGESDGQSPFSADVVFDADLSPSAPLSIRSHPKTSCHSDWHQVRALVAALDCNGDGIVDYGQILDGTFVDLNGNGVPDTCECIADLTGNGEVNGADISVLLGFWGKVPEPLPAADINQDGNVDGLDLAVLLGSWGPCK